MYQIKWAYGHWIILKDGRFYGSADTKEEAYRDIMEDEAED